MRWEHVDLSTGWWTIPAQHTKNGLAHRVPLSRPAIALLSALQATAGAHPYVFPSTRRAQTCLVNIRKAALRLRALTGVAFVPHDLRRTAASHMTSMGIPRLVISKILNHVESGVTRVYDRHSYDPEKREALERWGRKVLLLVGDIPEARNVVPFRKEGER
jgi:integrase